ncbi:MAG: hypothetical protein KBF21_18385 [Thermoanaerobaculia bacterium]|nr:hypothetical protein [Thermoanaerobaculia bacterium]MBP9826203.1 hypothetical protein [Thermoanaerobaculia bacterium]
MNGARTSEIWLGFAGVGAAATLALCLLGQVVAAQLGVPEAGSSIWAGCLASFAGSLAGALPLAQEIAGKAGDGAAAAGRVTGSPIAAIGKASLFRLLVALTAGLGAVLAGRWDRRALLFTLAASYVALLAVETWWLLSRLRAKRA